MWPVDNIEPENHYWMLWNGVRTLSALLAAMSTMDASLRVRLSLHFWEWSSCLRFSVS